MSIKRYSEIDEILLFNWNKCCEGAYNYVRLEPTKQDEITEQDVLAWEQVYSDYIKHFGLNKMYERYLKVSTKIATAQNNYVQTNQRRLLNVIRILEFDLEKIKSEMSKGTSIELVLMHLSKYMNFHQDPKKITVLQFFTMTKEYGRNN